MNLLNLTTRYSRGDSFAVPVLRAAFRRERRNRRKKAQFTARIHSHWAQCVRLEFQHPLARSVEIAGSFNDWRPGATWMISLGNGRWVKELLLPPGRYEYSFVVDGRWTPDPTAAESPPGLCGNHHSLLVVPHPHGNGHSRSFDLQPQRREMPPRCASTQ